jgi:hypothetical protein
LRSKLMLILALLTTFACMAAFVLHWPSATVPFYILLASTFALLTCVLAKAGKLLLTLISIGVMCWISQVLPQHLLGASDVLTLFFMLVILLSIRGDDRHAERIKRERERRREDFFKIATIRARLFARLHDIAPGQTFQLGVALQDQHCLVGAVLSLICNPYWHVAFVPDPARGSFSAFIVAPANPGDLKAALEKLRSDF